MMEGSRAHMIRKEKVDILSVAHVKKNYAASRRKKERSGRNFLSILHPPSLLTPPLSIRQTTPTVSSTPHPGLHVQKGPHDIHQLDTNHRSHKRSNTPASTDLTTAPRLGQSSDKIIPARLSDRMRFCYRYV